MNRYDVNSFTISSHNKVRIFLGFCWDLFDLLLKNF
jgi:hypothetical protein